MYRLISTSSQHSDGQTDDSIMPIADLTAYNLIF